LGIDPVSGGLLNEERIFNSDLIKNGNDEEKDLFGTPVNNSEKIYLIINF